MSGLGNIVPLPLPGECVYSIAAAFARRWFSGQRHGAVLLFGGAAPCARDVPARLSQLAQNLPATLRLGAEQLVFQHTGLPIHLPFLAASRRAQLVQDAIAGKAVQLRLGIAPSRMVCSRALRLCRLCIRSDQSTYGRAYWHREHQFAGVLVCPWHGIPLSITSVRPEAIHGRVLFAVPTQAKILGEEPLVGNERVTAMRVGRELVSLLQAGIPTPGPARLHAFYRQKLIAKGYAQPNHSITLDRLRRDIVCFYGHRLLRRIGCAIPPHYGWLATLVRKPRSHVQPLRHVLLLSFIDSSIDALTAAMKIEFSDRQSHEHPNRIRNQHRLEKLRPAKRRAWLRAEGANLAHQPERTPLSSSSSSDRNRQR